MPLIRTDYKALAFAWAFATAFLWFSLNNLLVELPEAMQTVDRLLLFIAAGGVFYTALFYAGHRLLRFAGMSGKPAYAALGALCLTTVYAALTLPALLEAFQQGSGVVLLIFPALLGAVFGFLYAHRAGPEPDTGAEALAAAAAGPGSDEALIEVDGERYFDGPVRVRTSIPLALLAAVFGSILGGLIRVALMTGWEVSLLDGAAPGEMASHAIRVLPGSAAMGLVAPAIISVPAMTLMIIAGHYAARALKWTGYGAYIGMGAVMPFVLTVVSMFLFLPIAVIIIVPNMIAMAIYRYYAGLEAEPVREDILASDPRGLVGAAHPRRRFGRVIGPRAKA